MLDKLREKIKEFNKKKLSEEEFLEEFYELKKEVHEFFGEVYIERVFANFLSSRADKLGLTSFYNYEGGYDLTEFPDHLIDYINPELNPWSAPNNRSDSLKLFLALNDDNVKDEIIL